MTALRVMVIDDEPLAIERMADLINRIDDVQLVSTHLTASDAIDRVPNERPDLILVDVEMPKVDGFDFVEALLKQGWLDTQSAPCICFVTAYPQFASDAFEKGVLDFLCKPVRLSRLERTIDRARLSLAQRDALARLQEINRQLEALREARTVPIESSLWVHQRGQMVRIPMEALDWVQAEGEYVRLHVRDQSFLLRGSITSLSDRLASRGFIRIHRSTIINQARLTALHSSRSGATALLDNGVELSVGRKYRQVIRQMQQDTAASAG